jgi:hypothetical protein
VIAGAAEVTVPDRAFLLAMGWALGTVHVENDVARWLAIVDPVDPDTNTSARVSKLASLASHSVSKRPIWLLEAAKQSSRSRPMIARIAGSRASRSALLTSS